MEKLITNENSINTSNSFLNSEACESVRSISKDMLNVNKHKKVSFPDERPTGLLESIGLNQSEDQSIENVNEHDASFVSVTTTSSIVDNKVFKRKIIR